MALRGKTLDAIRSHVALCEDVYAFMLEENRFLKIQVVERPRAGEVEKRYKAHIKA